VVQYFKKQDDGVAWKRYLDGKDGDFDNNNGVDNIFKFEDSTGSGAANAMLRRHPPVGADAGAVADAVAGRMDVDQDGGSRKKSKKSKSKKQSKRPSKGGKKQKKQSKSRKQRR
jgi:hypothetical protein